MLCVASWSEHPHGSLQVEVLRVQEPANLHKKGSNSKSNPGKDSNSKSNPGNGRQSCCSNHAVKQEVSLPLLTSSQKPRAAQGVLSHDEDRCVIDLSAE